MKLTTKLLLGATVVVGLSISAFAACATDVDFGSTDGTNGKKITGLMNGSNPQDAINYGQVFSITNQMNLTLESNLTAGDAGQELQIYHLGQMTCVSGSVKYDFPLSTEKRIVTGYPATYKNVRRPLAAYIPYNASLGTNVNALAWERNIYLRPHGTIPAGVRIYMHGCF